MIMFKELTNTQTQILAYNGAGLSTCEMAEKMGISIETVKTHLKNIKERVGLQKINELAAYYWVTVFGESFEDKRKQILGASLLLIFLLGFPINEDKARRNRVRRFKTEYVNEI